MAKTNPTISISLLSGIGEAKLKGILAPLKEALQKENLWWEKPEDFDARGLAMFLRNIFQLPKEVADSLYLIGTLAKDEYESFVMDEFLDAKIEVPSGNIKAALILWERSPELCASIIAKQDALRHRRYVYYRPKDKPTSPFQCPNAVEIENIRKNLSAWFDEKKRGKYSIVLCHEEADWIYFSIFHGGNIKHEIDVNGGDVNPLAYRPEVSDFIRVNKKDGVLGIYTTKPSITIETHYVDVIQKLFLPNSKYAHRNCYTLEPLKNGENTYIVGDAKDVVSAFKLKEVKFQYFGANMTANSDDIKVLWTKIDFSSANFQKAVFDVYFKGEDNPRTLTIIPPNKIDFPEEYDNELLNRILFNNKFLVEEDFIPKVPELDNFDKHFQLDLFDVLEPLSMAN